MNLKTYAYKKLKYTVKCFVLTFNQGGPGSVRDAVKYAIDIGYRSVDCAYAYLNEKEVGDGIQAKLDDGTIKDKKEIFITTKVGGLDTKIFLLPSHGVVNFLTSVSCRLFIFCLVLFQHFCFKIENIMQ